VNLSACPPHPSHLVGVDGNVGLFAGQRLDDGLDGGDARGAAHEDDFVDLCNAQLGVRQRFGDGRLAAVQQVGADLLKLGARQVAVNVLRAVLKGIRR